MLLDFFPSGSQFLWALAVLPAAAYLHGLLGLGFVTVAMPILVLFLDLRLAMVLTVPAALTLSFKLAFFGSGNMQTVTRFWFLPLCMAVGAMSGALIFQHAPAKLLLGIIAGSIVLFLSVDYLKKAHVHLPSQWVTPAAVIFGFLAGNTETAVNMGAPFLLIFCLIAGLSPLAVVQTINLCFFTGKVIHTITLSIGGPGFAAVAPTEWLAGALLAPICIWICAFGEKRRARTHVDTYRRWLKNFLKIMVVVMIGKIVLF